MSHGNNVFILEYPKNQHRQTTTAKNKHANKQRQKTKQNKQTNKQNKNTFTLISKLYLSKEKIPSNSNNIFRPLKTDVSIISNNVGYTCNLYMFVLHRLYSCCRSFRFHNCHFFIFPLFSMSLSPWHQLSVIYEYVKIVSAKMSYNF